MLVHRPVKVRAAAGMLPLFPARTHSLRKENNATQRRQNSSLTSPLEEPVCIVKSARVSSSGKDQAAGGFALRALAVEPQLRGIVDGRLLSQPGKDKVSLLSSAEDSELSEYTGAGKMDISTVRFCGMHQKLIW